MFTRLILYLKTWKTSDNEVLIHNEHYLPSECRTFKQIYLLLFQVDCVWESWSDWEACNVTCGDGWQSRGRIQTPQLHGGQPCTGDNTDWRSCFPRFCPGIFKVMTINDKGRAEKIFEMNFSQRNPFPWQGFSKFISWRVPLKIYFFPSWTVPLNIFFPGEGPPKFFLDFLCPPDY